MVKILGLYLGMKAQDTLSPYYVRDQKDRNNMSPSHLTKSTKATGIIVEKLPDAYLKVQRPHC